MCQIVLNDEVFGTHLWGGWLMKFDMTRKEIVTWNTVLISPTSWGYFESLSNDFRSASMMKWQSGSMCLNLAASLSCGCWQTWGGFGWSGGDRITSLLGRVGSVLLQIWADRDGWTTRRGSSDGLAKRKEDSVGLANLCVDWFEWATRCCSLLTPASTSCCCLSLSPGHRQDQQIQSIIRTIVTIDTIAASTYKTICPISMVNQCVFRLGGKRWYWGKRWLENFKASSTLIRVAR